MQGLHPLIYHDDLFTTVAKNRKPRYKGYRKLPVTANIALGTLGSEALIGQLNGETFNEERRILSAELTWAIEDLASADGPVQVGLAHGDYTDAEIEQCLEAVGAWDEGDKIAQEQAKRLVRIVGMVSEEETVLNDGLAIKTRLNWRIATSDTLRWWARNRGDAMTTGAEILISGWLHTVLV